MRPSNGLRNQSKTASLESFLADSLDDSRLMITQQKSCLPGAGLRIDALKHQKE